MSDSRRLSPLGQLPPAGAARCVPRCRSGSWGWPVCQQAQMTRARLGQRCGWRGGCAYRGAGHWRRALRPGATACGLVRECGDRLARAGVGDPAEVDPGGSSRGLGDRCGAAFGGGLLGGVDSVQDGADLGEDLGLTSARHRVCKVARLLRLTDKCPAPVRAGPRCFLRRWCPAVPVWLARPPRPRPGLRRTPPSRPARRGSASCRAWRKPP
jgi:hypothetical protein